MEVAVQTADCKIVVVDALVGQMRYRCKWPTPVRISNNVGMTLSSPRGNWNSAKMGVWKSSQLEWISTEWGPLNDDV
jgi:hypothetical protein